MGPMKRKQKQRGIHLERETAELRTNGVKPKYMHIFVRVM